jgi:hypothetical protein
MAADQPRWLDLVLRFERAIGVPAENAVRSDAYFDFVAHAQRSRARLGEVAEGLSRQWLHVLNLPAESDVRRLHEQLSRVERRLNKIAKDLEQSDGAGEAAD